ncbi:ammonium transporter [Arsenicicoccus sp. MKL-02]|uniref:Ammonium transporter n=1 Tax=Arsenicicoccus cauae TaxID=2663847 RepID=A0A6I3IYV6_9MICO|nr:ammonium transporter [Arsenicicoccus cauae]
MNTGDTAWVLVSAALVLLMTPGLAFFYGGMVRSKSVLNMMMMSFAAMGIVGVLWILVGYSMAFGDSIGGVLGNPLEFAGLNHMLNPDSVVGTVPSTVFAGFQAAFAIIAVALISGAIADRARFGAWCAFAAVWSLLVYFPAAHWVFSFDGVVSERGGWIANTVKAIDFAGGTAIHINAGAAALALALVLGRRRGFGKDPMRPHNLTLVMLGVGLLWFGWFGFNAGSALGAGPLAGIAWINTLGATAAGMCGWLLTERLRDGHATSLGAASGVVAGLVAITPACSTVSPVGGIVIGLVAGIVCAYAVGLKFRLGFDDSLDVVGVHLVGGLVGTLAVGFLATDAAPVNTVNGLFYGGGVDQLWRQAVGAVAVMLYSFVVSWVIAKVIDVTMGFRASDEDELQGVDQTQHAETGYDLTPIAIGRRPGTAAPLADAIGASSHWGQGTRTTEDVNS